MSKRNKTFVFFSFSFVRKSNLDYIVREIYRGDKLLNSNLGQIEKNVTSVSDSYKIQALMKRLSAIRGNR